MATDRLPRPKWDTPVDLRERIRACDYVHVSLTREDPNYPYTATMHPRGRQIVKETGINAVDALGAALAKAFPELNETG